MRVEVQPLSSASIDAIVLASAAAGLLGLTWILLGLLTWCMGDLAENDKISILRVGGALTFARVVLVLHCLNMATFLFIKASWQDLAQWFVRLLPENANALIMLVCYYIVLSICKVTWRDIFNQIRRFVASKKGAVAVGA